MSRLDDELRKAFRRELPSADFAERVLKAVAAAPPPRRKWWDELLSLLATPKVRLVAVGVAATLLIVLWATQSRRLQGPDHDRADSRAGVVEPAPVPDTPPTKDVGPGVNGRGLAGGARPRPHHRMRHDGQVSERRPQVAKSEGEIAKEQLMLALHIAGASLNEAQRMVKAGE